VPVHHRDHPGSFEVPGERGGHGSAVVVHDRYRGVEVGGAEREADQRGDGDRGEKSDDQGRPVA
jgi:hypothetical protein